MDLAIMTGIIITTTIIMVVHTWVAEVDMGTAKKHFLPM